MSLQSGHFYIIKDEFFDLFKDYKLIVNKEENRPFYYCMEDKEHKDILWVIPMSTKVEKFKNVIRKDIKKYKRCDKVHICKVFDDSESAFVIQDMFPITKNFISRQYTKNGIHFKFCDTKNQKIINKKANKMLGLISRGIRLLETQPKAIQIKNILLSGRSVCLDIEKEVAVAIEGEIK